MKSTVVTTVDGAGRVVIPKAMRSRLGLGPGAAVAVSEGDGVLEIRPAPLGAKVVRRGGVAVIAATAPVTPIDDDDVRATLEATRRP